MRRVLHGASVHLLQGFENLCKLIVAGLKVRNGAENGVVAGLVAGILQLNGKLSQLSGMGCVVTDHVAHQRDELIVALRG